MLLSDSITELKYISSKYEGLLNTLGIFTIKDLLTYFPRAYIDSSEVEKIINLQTLADPEKKYTIKARVIDFKNTYIRGRKSIQRAVLEDSTASIDASWFNQPYLSRALKINSIYLFSGKIKIKGKKIFFSPTVFEEAIESRENIHLGRISPEYRLTAGISKKWFRNRIKNLIDSIEKLPILDEISPTEKEKSSVTEYIKEIHFPSAEPKLNEARNYLSILELVNIHLKLENKRQKQKKYLSMTLDKDKVQRVVQKIIANLEFELTSDQLNIMDELTDEISTNTSPLNHLIQGDVGSGKTIIAIIMSAIFSQFGYQSVVLTPTTILANQHYNSFQKVLSHMPEISIELVIASNKNTKSADIMIGTSAVLARQSNLIKHLGIIMVDEQHRFGVAQREDLLKPFGGIISSKHFPHLINMTATPIPRTIAQTFFGDIKVSTINTKPKDRKPIKTFLVPDKKRKSAYEWIEQNILEKNQQVYWVCPLINESVTLEAKAAQAVYSELKAYFKNFKVGLLHGKLKPLEKDKIMKQFISNKIQVLVSTSVIEVGIDVANATTMVIEGAERFGLAQLHQIRGRVGRSNKQSWCYLFYTADDAAAPERLKYLATHSNGLEIAEYDLRLRGPGEVYGTRQSGIPDLKIAKLNDVKQLAESRDIAQKLYKSGIRKIELFS